MANPVANIQSSTQRKVPLMPSPFLIIDGYNLMHEAGLARATYGPGDLARLRHELLVKLVRRLTFEERKRCTVVFDAIDAPANLPGRFIHEGIHVLFAEPGHEADELIEKLISQNSAPRRLTVVSSDHRIQNAIRKRRGIGIDSDVFLKQLESPDRQIGPSRNSASPTADPNRDLKFWMEEFGGVSSDSIQQELIALSNDPKSDWDDQIEKLQQQLKNPAEIDKWLNESTKSPPPSKKPGK